MTKETHLRVSDMRGLHRLANDATVGLTDLVEAMHHTVARTPAIFGASPRGRTKGITGLVYRSVRGVTRLVGNGIDALLATLEPLIAKKLSSQQREAVVSAIDRRETADQSVYDGLPAAQAANFGFCQDQYANAHRR